MGPYLAQPITQKHTDKGQSQKTRLRFHFAEMQGILHNYIYIGWRRAM